MQGLLSRSALHAHAGAGPIDEIEVLFEEARRRERRRRLIVAAVAIVVVAGACAGAGALAAGRHAEPRPKVVSTSPVGPVARVVSCSKSHTPLHMVLEDKLPAAGQHFWGVMITSASKRSCSLGGYASVTLLGPGATPLSTTDKDSPTIGIPGVHTVDVAVSKPVSFLFVTSSGDGYIAPPVCPLVTGLDVRLPRSSARTLAFPPTAVPIHDVSGGRPGDCDAVSISPIFRGTPQRGMCPACAASTPDYPAAPPGVGREL